MVFVIINICSSCAVITFNTAGKPPPTNENAHVFDLEPFTDADVLVVGLELVNNF